MPLRNPFARTTIPYRRVSNEYTESDGHQTDTRSSTLPREIDHLMTEQARQRSKRKHAFCYALFCLASLVMGIILGQFFRLEFEADGYPGT